MSSSIPLRKTVTAPDEVNSWLGGWARAAPECLLCVVLLVLLVRLLGAGAYRAAIVDSNMQGIEHRQYYRAAERLAAGERLYVAPSDNIYNDAYPYSPWPALIFRVLPGADVHASFRAWLVVNVCLMMGSAFGMVLLLNPKGVIAFTQFAALFMITGFRFWPTVCELALGNVHVVLLALLVVMIGAAKHGRWVLFAAALAIAAALKTWMIGFAIAPVLAQRPIAAVYSIVFYLALLTLGFAVVGFEQIAEFVPVMRRYAVQPALVTLSAPGVARQFFGPNIHMQPLLVSPGLRVLTVFVAALLVLAACVTVWHARADRTTRDGGLPVVAVACCALVLLPLCHLQYFLLLLPAIWFLFSGAGLTRPSHRSAAVIVALAAYLPLSVPTPAHTPIPEWARVGWPRLLTAVPLACAVTLLTGCAWVALRQRDDRRAARAAAGGGR